MLAQIQQLVKTKYYDPHFGGKDWDAVVEQHRAAVLNSDSLDEFEGAANNMLKELGSGALGLLRGTSKISCATPSQRASERLRPLLTATAGYFKTWHRAVLRIAPVSTPAIRCCVLVQMKSFPQPSPGSQWTLTRRS